MTLAHPYWPALMGTDTARAYLDDIAEESFHALVNSYKIAPRGLPFRRTMWRKADLDRMLDQLPAKGLTVVEAADKPEAADPAEAALQAIEARAARRGRG